MCLLPSETKTLQQVAPQHTVNYKTGPQQLYSQRVKHIPQVPNTTQSNHVDVNIRSSAKQAVRSQDIQLMHSDRVFHNNATPWQTASHKGSRIPVAIYDNKQSDGLKAPTRSLNV